MEFVSRDIESKKVLWFEEINQYLILDIPFYKVFYRFLNGVNSCDILLYCEQEFSLSSNSSQQILASCIELKNQLQIHSKDFVKNESLDLLNTPCNYVENYLLNNKIIKVQFSSKTLLDIIHPKFAHLCSGIVKDFCEDHTLSVVEFENDIALMVDGGFVGRWTRNELHFLQGKFAMALLNCSNNKIEDDWLAVLHASAVSFKNKCVAFLGESGSGKSTATTLLTANGFDLLADDFVPIDASTNKVLSFPAAISIKESMLAEFELCYPQLKSSVLRSKDSKVSYKYLYPPNSLPNLSVSKTCEALVFIKFENGVKDCLEEISKIEALEYLIPDSWISPKKINASSFLDWLVNIPCYKLHYSNNAKMISIIDNLMKDEL